MEEASVTFDDWVKWALDHPVAAKAGDEWCTHLPDKHDEGGGWLDRPPERALGFVTKLFENPLAYLSSYSDAQIGEGIWFIVFRVCSKHFDGLVDPASILVCEHAVFGRSRMSRAICSHRNARTMCEGTTRSRWIKLATCFGILL